MYARLTFLKLSRDTSDLAIKVYNDEILPVVRSQKGNIGCWLLEPTNATDDYISLTEWVSPNDADAYEASGTYRSLVEKIKEYYTGKPVLKTYNIAEFKMSATATS